jgi:hypothetical protein
MKADLGDGAKRCMPVNVSDREKEIGESIEVAGKE